jgi:hypothetical protein
MNWIKENWFKLSILLILLLGLSIFYKFTEQKKQTPPIKLPSIETEKKISPVQMEKCNELGIQLHEEDKKTYPFGAFEPKYKYSVTKETCLYSGGGFLTPTSWERFVKDSFTNDKLIITFNPNTKVKDDDSVLDSINKYWESHRILFEE